MNSAAAAEMDYFSTVTYIFFLANNPGSSVW